MVAHRLSPSGPFVTGDRLRLYGGSAQASLAEVSYLAGRVEADWLDVQQEDALDQGALIVEAEPYPLGRIAVNRFLFDGAGPIVGDENIKMRVVQSIDGGVNWTDVGTAEIEYEPNEAGRKIVPVGAVVPAGALLTVQADYPANYDPVDRSEAVLIVLEVVA